MLIWGPDPTPIDRRLIILGSRTIGGGPNVPHAALVRNADVQPERMAMNNYGG